MNPGSYKLTAQSDEPLASPNHRRLQHKSPSSYTSSSHHLRPWHHAAPAGILLDRRFLEETESTSLIIRGHYRIKVLRFTFAVLYITTMNEPPPAAWFPVRPGKLFSYCSEEFEL